MKTILKWFWLLNKRLYKKPLFLVLLVMIPLAVALLGMTEQQESGFLHIALCAQGKADETAEAIFADLEDGSDLIVFTRCGSAEEAARLVQTGRADAAWVFPENLARQLTTFVREDSRREPVVTVLQREETVPLRLSQEKLATALFKQCAKPIYLNFVRQELPQLAGLSDEELMAYYQSVLVGESLFAFETMDTDVPLTTTGYLLSPVRGLLGIVVLLSGLAAALYYTQDEQNGVFAWVPERRRPLTLLACESVAVLNTGVAALLALFAARLGGPPLREIGAMLLYGLCCCLYGMLLRQLTGGVKLLGALVPLLAVGMMVVCPVFFDMRSLVPLQMLFPLTYYLRAAYQNVYFLYLALYTLGIGALYLLACALRRKA